MRTLISPHLMICWLWTSPVKVSQPDDLLALDKFCLACKWFSDTHLVCDCSTTWWIISNGHLRLYIKMVFWYSSRVKITTWWYRRLILWCSHHLCSLWPLLLPLEESEVAFWPWGRHRRSSGWKLFVWSGRNPKDVTPETTAQRFRLQSWYLWEPKIMATVPIVTRSNDTPIS